MPRWLRRRWRQRPKTRDPERDLSTLEVTHDPAGNYLPEVKLAEKTATREWYSFCHEESDSLRGETLCDRGSPGPLVCRNPDPHRDDL